MWVVTRQGMIELTGFQRDLLYALAGLDEPNGIDVQDALEDYYGSEVISARVYQNLDRLSDMGFVEKGERDSRTNYYQITDAGRRAIESRRSWEDQYLEPMLHEEKA